MKGNQIINSLEPKNILISLSNQLSIMVLLHLTAMSTHEMQEVNKKHVLGILSFCPETLEETFLGI